MELLGADFVGNDIIPSSGMSKKTHFLLQCLKLKRNLNVVAASVCSGESSVLTLDFALRL